MNKSKTYQTILEHAQKAFGDNLCSVLVGGSIGYKDDPNDIDTVVVVKKFKASEIKEFLKLGESLGLSARVITEMMWNERYFDGKVATMLYKGAYNIMEQMEYHLSFSDLQKIHRPLVQQNLSEIHRSLAKGKIDEAKAVDLLTQLIVILDGRDERLGMRVVHK